MRHSTARDLAALATELAKSEEERRHLSDLVAVLRQRVANETSSDEQVNLERKLLEQRLEEAHLHLADIKTSWSDKIAALETQVNINSVLQEKLAILTKILGGTIEQTGSGRGSRKEKSNTGKRSSFRKSVSDGSGIRMQSFRIEQQANENKTAYFRS